MDFCLQSEEIDRLRVVVVTTHFKGPRPICRQRVPRQSDYGYATRGCVRFKPLRHFPTIHNRQADIHQDDIGRLGAREIVALRAILGGNHAMALSLQALGQHVTVHFVVFDQQDRGHCLNSPESEDLLYILVRGSPLGRLVWIWFQRIIVGLGVARQNRSLVRLPFIYPGGNAIGSEDPIIDKLFPTAQIAQL
jgi:hypothetical protein